MKTFALDGVSPYRKHQGKTFRWIRSYDPKYFHWLVSTIPLQIVEESSSVSVEDYVSGEVTLSLLDLRSLLRQAYDEGREDEHMECYPSIGPSFPRSWDDSETLKKFQSLADDIME